MNIFTPLNVEQSLSRYLADKLLAAGYKILWHDTRQTEGSGTGSVVTILREFPEEPSALARQGGKTGEGIINVPAFSVFANSPSTQRESRMGIGESSFEWNMEVRIDGFADTELEWYSFQSSFKEWFVHPDVEIDLRDYEDDLSVAAPVAQDEKIRLVNTDTFRRELHGVVPAVRYYINVIATAQFIE